MLCARCTRVFFFLTIPLITVEVFCTCLGYKILCVTKRRLEFRTRILWNILICQGRGSCFCAGIEKLMIGVWRAHTSHLASGDRLEGVRKMDSVLVCAPPLIACTHPLYVPSVHTYIRCTQLRKCHAKILIAGFFFVAPRTTLLVCLLVTNSRGRLCPCLFFFTLLLFEQNY